MGPQFSFIQRVRHFFFVSTVHVRAMDEKRRIQIWTPNFSGNNLFWILKEKSFGFCSTSI